MTDGVERTHRIPVPSPVVRGRVVAAAVAAGAFVAAGQTMNNTANAVSGDPQLLASGTDATAAMGLGGPTAATEYLPISRPVERQASDQVQAMVRSERVVAERAAREAEARRPLFVRPTDGVLTSAYGPRWGTTHWGIDIANAIGTPIRAAADGLVIESGPASGFGMWVRVRHNDGTVTVYGHINRALVDEGEWVRAGDTIAEMGNRGNSTGPHLHFEVWSASGQKINPLSWLRKHGISL